MPGGPVIRNVCYGLAHVPDLVRYGSKPRRELSRDRSLREPFDAALRPFEQAVRYAPNQVFIGNRTPAELASRPRPWFRAPVAGALDELRQGAFGEIVEQDLFLALLKQADVLEPPLFELSAPGAARLNASLAAHPRFGSPGARPRSVTPDAVVSTGGLGIDSAGTELGRMHRDLRAEGRDDENLAAHHLLENLCAKASGALALEGLLARAGLEPDAVDFLISCGEEAVGDRYQRGGGSMAKAIGEMTGCVRASGMDVKNFCAAPASALVTAGALVQTGLHERIVVVGGGSLAKLGMKFAPFLERDMPILEDCLASLAFLVTADDGQSPVLRLEPHSVGLAPIGASTSDEALYRSLLLAPLEALGLRIADVDRFAPELHNPEIMELSGSGDVAHKNFRSIAAMAVLAGQLEKAEMDAWVERAGMPGFAPTQGHIPSAVAYLGHAARALRAGELRRVMFLAKASLFLGRITELFDGVSFLVEANPRA